MRITQCCPGVLVAASSDHAGMEAAGVYWKLLMNALDGKYGLHL
jgi:hypothetical protein